MLQDQHYQSLARADLVVKVNPEEKTRPDSGFEEEEEEGEYFSREVEESSRKEGDDLMKLILGPNPTYSGKTRFTFEDEAERNGNETTVQTYVKRSQG